MSLMFL